MVVGVFPPHIDHSDSFKVLKDLIDSPVVVVVKAAVLPQIAA
ncbi:MAG: hypothetical protein WB795_01235 [Candidatus Acidiferrales bacterium]